MDVALLKQIMIYFSIVIFVAGLMYLIIMAGKDRSLLATFKSLLNLRLKTRQYPINSITTLIKRLNFLKTVDEPGSRPKRLVLQKPFFIGLALNKELTDDEILLFRRHLNNFFNHFFSLSDSISSWTSGRDTLLISMDIAENLIPNRDSVSSSSSSESSSTSPSSSGERSTPSRDDEALRRDMLTLEYNHRERIRRLRDLGILEGERIDSYLNSRPLFTNDQNENYVSVNALREMYDNEDFVFIDSHRSSLSHNIKEPILEEKSTKPTTKRKLIFLQKDKNE